MSAQPDPPGVWPRLGFGRGRRLLPGRVTAHGISDAFRDAEGLASALDQVLSGRADGATGLAAYQRRRDQALREIFEITCQLSAYPPVPRFIELQKQLGAAIDKEAADLAFGRDGRRLP